jgi:hypothetical protein
VKITDTPACMVKLANGRTSIGLSIMIGL